MNSQPIKWTSDEGNEFVGEESLYILKKKYHMMVEIQKGKNKSSIIGMGKIFYKKLKKKLFLSKQKERFNRTLKQRFERYFTFNKTHNWVDALIPMIHNYNDGL